jgi:hypothetical protein
MRRRRSREARARARLLGRRSRREAAWLPKFRCCAGSSASIHRTPLPSDAKVRVGVCALVGRRVGGWFGRAALARGGMWRSRRRSSGSGERPGRGARARWVVADAVARSGDRGEGSDAGEGADEVVLPGPAGGQVGQIAPVSALRARPARRLPRRAGAGSHSREEQWRLASRGGWWRPAPLAVRSTSDAAVLSRAKGAAWGRPAPTAAPRTTRLWPSRWSPAAGSVSEAPAHERARASRAGCDRPSDAT